MDPTGGRVPLDGLRDGAGSQLGKCGSLCGVAGVHVGFEGHGQFGLTGDQPGEGSARPHRGELVVVANEHQAGAGAVDREGEAGQIGIVGHSRFVDHHHRSIVEGGLAVVEAPEHRGERS